MSAVNNQAWQPLHITPERLTRQLRYIVYTFFALSIVLIQLQNVYNRLTAIALIVTGMAVLYLVRRGQLRIAAYLMPTMLMIALAAFSLNGRGIVDPGVFGMLTAIALGGMLHGRKGIFIYGAMAAVSIIFLYIAGETGIVDQTELTRELNDFSTLTYLIAYTIGGIVILNAVVSNLEANVAVARNNAAALETLNYELEARVDRRTKQLDDARAHAEMLSNIGRTTNAATTYSEILEAIVAETGPLDFLVSLNIYENHKKANATYVDTVAILSPGHTTAQEIEVKIPILQFRADNSDLLIIEDINQFPFENPELMQQFRERNIHAVMSYDFRLGERTIGTLTFASESPRSFGDFEQKLIQGAGDLAAAATERSRLYQEQVKIAEELRQLDNMKSQFLASMSHELRTPLNAILNFTEFMQMGMLGPVTPKQEDALTKALGSGRHLLSLINDILDITKIEAGMMRLFIEENIDLYRELDAVIASTETGLRQKDVQFIKDIDENLPRIVGDKRRIRQIMLNLLSNAIKFTEEGSITFSVKHEKDIIRFMVSDTGPGIAQEDIPVVFAPFEQTETGIKHAGGTGLGLPITKRLTEAHGGRLWLESEVGQGASFFVELPVASEELRQMIELPKAKAHV